MLAFLAAALLLHVLLLLRLPANSATALQAKPELVMDTFMLAPATAAAPAPTLTPVPEEAVAPKPIVQPIEPEAVPVRPQRPKPKKKIIERPVACRGRRNRGSRRRRAGRHALLHARAVLPYRPDRAVRGPSGRGC